MPNNKIDIRFGALADSVAEQLNQQSFDYDSDVIKHIGLDVEALNRLRIRGYLPDSTSNILHKKLFNKIVDHVTKYNGIEKIIKK